MTKVQGPLPTITLSRHGLATTSALGWSDQDVNRCLWTTIDELTDEFGDRHTDAHIIGVAIGALRDLRGSTGVAALPELISRLVRVRLVDAVPCDGWARPPAEPGVLAARLPTE